MLYRLVKLYARFALKICCRKIIINQPTWLKAKGPLLLACNHPNSILDGLILTLLFDQPVYSLARGDAFRNKKYEKLLRWMHLLPVYRTSEGVENLEHNYTTFEACHEIFQQSGIVIIFSEGKCVNEWHLRSLKKGTARLATSTWLQEIDLTVLPVGINYSPFRSFGKNVFINFGETLNQESILEHASDGKMFLSFNEQLKENLQPLVFEIDSNDKNLIRRKLFVHQPTLKKLLLAIPALLGLIIHSPIYFPAKVINQHYFDNDHYDSTMAAILTLAYPIYLILIFILGCLFFNWQIALIAFLTAPFFAWSCVQLKFQS